MDREKVAADWFEYTISRLQNRGGERRWIESGNILGDFRVNNMGGEEVARRIYI